MIDRLTKRTENGGVRFSNGEYWNTVYPQNENCLTDIHRMAIKLCDLEDKIEQGKIVELPCKVGDIVYAPHWHWGTYIKGDIMPYQITNITITQNKKGVWIKKYRAMEVQNGKTIDWQLNFEFDAIGKTVFLDRATAEAKLRELKGAGE